MHFFSFLFYFKENQDTKILVYIFFYAILDKQYILIFSKYEIAFEYLYQHQNIKFLFIFVDINKKKVLDPRNFSTSGFRLIYMFWGEHDLTIFRKCLSVCYISKILWHCISRTNGRKLMKLDIQLHLDIIWCWLNFGAYRLRSSNIVWNFWFL